MSDPVEETLTAAAREFADQLGTALGLPVNRTQAGILDAISILRQRLGEFERTEPLKRADYGNLSRIISDTFTAGKFDPINIVNDLPERRWISKHRSMMILISNSEHLADFIERSGLEKALQPN